MHTFIFRFGSDPFFFLLGSGLFGVLLEEDDDVGAGIGVSWN